MHWDGMEETQQLFTLLLDKFDQGGCFFIADREKVIKKYTSANFDLPNVMPGTPNQAGGVAEQVLKAQQVLELHLDRHMYGTRITILAGPIWSRDESEIMGCWVLALPKVHKMVRLQGCLLQVQELAIL